MSPNPAPLVIGKNVAKRYERVEAVKGVNFTVHQGECLGFLGPNGAGKSSVMKMIQCFSPLSGGEIAVDGLAVGKDDRAIKGLLGVAPQEESLDHDLTVTQNLEIYAGYFGIRRSAARGKAEELLRFFHLEEKGGERIFALSGGMRRRLVIARALINDPKLLILDEPTTGLDPQARRVIWQKLEKLKKGGVTLILTTHYMEEATRLCDRIAIMDQGRIIDTGLPTDLIAKHIGHRALRFTPIDGVVEYLAGAGHRYERDHGELLLFTDRPAEMTSQLSERGVTAIESRDTTLEDLFRLLTTSSAEEEGMA